MKRHFDKSHKNVETRKRVRKCITLILLLLLGLPSVVICAEFEELVVEPKDVGVFWSNKTQQFRAYGIIDASKSSEDVDNRVEVTEEVVWDSSNPSIVSIDSSGMATALQSYGKVTITAKYPKPKAAAAANHILFLLREKQL